MIAYSPFPPADSPLRSAFRTRVLTGEAVPAASLHLIKLRNEFARPIFVYEEALRGNVPHCDYS